MFVRSVFSSYYRLLTGASLAFAVFALTGGTPRPGGDRPL
ncbi:hypothetical protein ABIF31_004592 [Bradyrhizobium elkanii]|nr:hypothetical protein [Bradyrhizobium elkanii]